MGNENVARSALSQAEQDFQRTHGMDRFDWDNFVSYVQWRRQSPALREKFMLGVDDLVGRRQDTGAQMYPDGFSGDPLDHLDEELADAPYYSFYARRERAAYRSGIRELARFCPVPALREAAMHLLGEGSQVQPTDTASGAAAEPVNVSAVSDANENEWPTEVQRRIHDRIWIGYQQE